ncbi:O-antigen ligase family protein [Flavobacterium sp. N1994]|uniref:O-antigen ligase family protein n=1 Tax=Flavobacterium sp. N1994 TaxID=2986827 RepID=UPI002222E54A|nr:O-antigen ligase family protein [Flavobacterium sp. N1994]
MKINKSEFYYILLFIICVVVPTFNNFELTFLTWGLAALITVQRTYSAQIFRLIFIKIVIIVIAAFAIFFYDYKTYNIIRDFTYLIKPVLGLLIGYQIIRKIKSKSPFMVIVYGSLVLAVMHILILLISAFIFKIASVSELRQYGGYFSDFEVYGLVILLFSNRIGLELPSKKKLLFILLIAFSVFLYLARTNFIQLAILSIALMGYFKLTPKSIKVVTFFALTVLIGYGLIYVSNPKRKGDAVEEFLYKIKIAPIEPFKTKINQDDWKDFNDNYRSFENIMTVKQVTHQGWRAIFFGKGMGSYIDIGREMWTNDGELIRFVPTLHNSYMTILLKAGLSGVLLMLIFIYYLQKKYRYNSREIINLNNLILGTALFLILSNWVFMGLYFKVDNKALLIGFLIAYREKIAKKLISTNQSGYIES